MTEEAMAMATPMPWPGIRSGSWSGMWAQRPPMLPQRGGMGLSSAPTGGAWRRRTVCAEYVAVIVNIASVALSPILDGGSARGGRLRGGGGLVGRTNIKDGRGQGLRKRGHRTEGLEEEEEEGRRDDENGGRDDEGVIR